MDLATFLYELGTDRNAATKVDRAEWIRAKIRCFDAPGVMDARRARHLNMAEAQGDARASIPGWSSRSATQDHHWNQKAEIRATVCATLGHNMDHDDGWSIKCQWCGRVAMRSGRDAYAWMDEIEAAEGI